LFRNYATIKTDNQPTIKSDNCEKSKTYTGEFTGPGKDFTLSPEIRIRKAYHEPPSQVIRSYASLGYGKKSTAILLGISKQSLNRLIAQYNLSPYFRPYIALNSSCKSSGRKPNNTFTLALVALEVDLIKKLIDRINEEKRKKKRSIKQLS